MFQSLFYWILFSYWQKITLRKSLYMVSILILLDSILLFEKAGKKYTFENKFQSLFYWILFFYMTNSEGEINFYIRFQSLFYWILFSYKLAGTTSPNNLFVSILILLDSLLLLRLEYDVAPFEFEFQSLFYWILFFYKIKF